MLLGDHENGPEWWQGGVLIPMQKKYGTGSVRLKKARTMEWKEKTKWKCSVKTRF